MPLYLCAYKAEQLQAIHTVVTSNDGFVKPVTGFGKSVCYMVVPLTRQVKNVNTLSFIRNNTQTPVTNRVFFFSNKSRVRWPTSATAKLTFPRQNLLFHGKTYFLTAKLTFSRQNLLFHGKTYFLPKIWNLQRESGNGIRNTVKVVERLKLPRKAISSTIHLVRYS